MKVSSRGGTDRFLMAEKNISKGSKFMTIPMSLCPTLYIALSTPTGQLLQAKGIEGKSKDQFFMCVYLLEEKLKGRDSFWYPWIESLPDNTDNFPHFYGPEDLVWLQNTSILGTLEDNHIKYKSDYEFLGSLLTDFKEKISYRDFVHMFLVVLSRNFTLFGAGN